MEAGNHQMKSCASPHFQVGVIFFFRHRQCGAPPVLGLDCVLEFLQIHSRHLRFMCLGLKRGWGGRGIWWSLEAPAIFLETLVVSEAEQGALWGWQRLCSPGLHCDYHGSPPGFLRGSHSGRLVPGAQIPALGMILNLPMGYKVSC